MNTKKSWYRFAAFFIIAGLAASSAGVAASMSEDVFFIEEPVSMAPVTVQEFVDESDTSMADSSILPDNDTLFRGYIEQLFYGGGNMPLADYGQEILEESELSLYQEWKAFITAIAAGGGSTLMPIPADFHVNIKTDAGAVSGDQAKQAMTASLRKVLNCLMVDCPYEFYWYDKTAGYRYSYSTYTVENNGDSVNLFFSDLRVTLYSAIDYQSGGNTTVSAAKAQATAAAAARAQAIVAAHAGKTDYEKLTAYKDEICSLVSYNYGALSGVSYGDPWQMIYVFDGDPSTNVVCEGYSKAFQYLCDMTDFAGDVVCYTVYGTMSTSSGGGAHMWNIVTLAGQNYLVDVTNSDSGSIGQNGSLFLAGGTGSVASGYRFSSGASYIYDQEQKNLYGERILTLSSTSYVPQAAGSITNLSIAGWVYGSQPNTPTWDSTHTDVQPVIAYKERLAGNEAYSTVIPVNAGDYMVRISYPGTDQHTAFSAEAAFSITAKPLTESMVLIGDGPFFCTGQEIRPAVVLDGSLMTDHDYEIQYLNNIFPDQKAEVIVTGQGNYQGTVTKTFSISYIAPPENYLMGSLGLNGWYTSDVTISARDWTVSQDGAASFSDEITVSQDGTHSLALHFKENSSSYLTDAQTISLKIDKTAPMGRILLDTAEWDSFLEELTFEHYTAEHLAVTIVGEDSVSGILEISYYISNVSMTLEELQSMTLWKEYQDDSKPLLMEDIPQIVYVRIRDNAGNISYLNTNGMILHTEEPEEEEKDPIIKPEISSGLSDIPQSLAEAGFDNTYKIHQKIKQVMLDHEYAEGNWALFDVKPLVSHDGGTTWTPAAPENFPKEGLSITLPYPQGASEEGYEFFAVHMFSHKMNGFQPGEIEILKDITATSQGIRFTVHGLSPIAVAWRAVKKPDDGPNQEPDDEPGQNPDDTPDQEPGDTPGQNPDDTPGQNPDNTPNLNPDNTPILNPDQNSGNTPILNPDQSSGNKPEQGSDKESNGNKENNSGNKTPVIIGSNNSSNNSTGSNTVKKPSVSGSSNTSASNSIAKATSVRKNPKTGDDSNLWFYELCMLMSVITAELLIIRFRMGRR